MITAASLLGNNSEGAPMPEPEFTPPIVKKQQPMPEPEFKPIIKKQQIKYTKEELFVARVLYSETSSIATTKEKILICCVIQNRIKNRAFGNLPNAYQVCKQPRAFSCVGSTKNKNWSEFKPDLNKYTKICCELAKYLIKMGTTKISNNPNLQNVVYYHDKSISKPKGWDNKYWKAVLVQETPHFKFYKIVPAKK